MDKNQTTGTRVLRLLTSLTGLHKKSQVKNLYNQ